jgi:ankyrin repeat protein
VKALLIYQANIYAKDERKWTPLHYAAYNGFPAVCKKLLSWSADTDPKLRDTRNSQNKLAFNICKNPETKLGFRIIWKSATEGDLDMVRILLREGQEMDEPTQDKQNTALHLAAQHGHILIVRFLVEMGAEVDKLNNQA